MNRRDGAANTRGWPAYFSAYGPAPGGGDGCSEFCFPCLSAHTDDVWSGWFSPGGLRVSSASFGPDGRRIVTAAGNTARVWDVVRTEAIARERAIVITAAFARGIGWRTNVEAADLLMQGAPQDLYAAARRELLDPAKYSTEEIAVRERALEETIGALHAPLHPNCYLSPTQFAEKFGLKASGSPTPTHASRRRRWLIFLAALAALASAAVIGRTKIAQIVQHTFAFLPH